LEQYHGTTILSVRLGKQVSIGGDGQVSMGDTIMKGNARKVRRLYKDKVLAGFALTRAAVELAKEWRTDRALRRLEALLAVADDTASLIISGNGDVIEPEGGIMAIGSGGSYAQAAARALVENTDLSAHEVTKKALAIAADICVYTNQNIIIEDLEY